MLKSSFCEDILVKYEFKSENLRGVLIDLILNKKYMHAIAPCQLQF